jgi:hypothetical protein
MTDLLPHELITLYHVTTGKNLEGILESGIDPAYSRSSLKASWYVSWDKVLWAVIHIQDRFNCNLDDCFVCSAEVDHANMRRTNQVGIFYTRQLFRIQIASPARFILEDY